MAADGTYSRATASHDLEITRLANAITLTSSPSTLAVNATHDFAATHSGSGVITWSVTNPDGSSTTLATMHPTTGVLRANGLCRIKVTAAVAADDTYSNATTSHTLTIIRTANTLTFTSPPSTLAVNATHTFAATHSGSGAITWSVTNRNGSSTPLATINRTTGLLTPNEGGWVRINATVAADDTYSSATGSHYLRITRLANSMLTSWPSTLVVNAIHTFAATHSGSRMITWSVTNPDDSSTTLATINRTTGVPHRQWGG